MIREYAAKMTRRYERADRQDAGNSLRSSARSQDASQVRNRAAQRRCEAAAQATRPTIALRVRGDRCARRTVALDGLPVTLADAYDAAAVAARYQIHSGIGTANDLRIDRTRKRGAVSRRIDCEDGEMATASQERAVRLCEHRLRGVR